MKLTVRVCTLLMAGMMVIGTAAASFAATGRGGGTAVLVPLSADETYDLQYMRAEEQLARDIYLASYSKWSGMVFSNIASSEQRHTDTMQKMLDKYSVIGELPGLQTLYNDLMEKSSLSYVDALLAGALIEETDMVDLQHAIDSTIRLDLRTAYQNLMEGSKNHLRAFVTSLAAQGVVYQPVLLSPSLYEAIIGL